MMRFRVCSVATAVKVVLRPRRGASANDAPARRRIDRCYGEARRREGRCERAQRSEPRERSEPAKRLARESVGESEGRSPSE